MTVNMNALNEMVLEKGAKNSSIIEVSGIYFDPELRKACEQNYCGNFGKNWTCPPLCGEVEDLIKKAKQFSHAVLFQTIYNLEDSYDIEGMSEAVHKHNAIVKEVFSAAKEMLGSNLIVLGAGGCTECESCARRDDEPCRHPDLAITSLEAYGMYVSKIAEQGGMKYINGQNTVTYFGMILFNA
jgi:predicted metal-binding protein